MQKELRGPFVVLITPLDGKRNQDTKSLGRLVNYYVESEVNGLTALGESAEVDKLSAKERDQNVKLVMDYCKNKIPVVVGASQESTETTIDASLTAQEMGATAVMIAPPRNPKLRDEKILDYYAAIGDSINIPIVMQDYPETNRPYMSPQLMAKIAAEVHRVKYLKLEDPPTPIKLTKVLALTKGKLKVFGALGGKNSLWELDRGAIGVMTASPTPEYLVALWQAHESGNREKAREIFFYNLPLIHSYSELGLSVRKEVLFQRKVIKTTAMKQPAAELDSRARGEVKELLTWTENKILDATGIKPIHWD